MFSIPGDTLFYTIYKVTHVANGKFYVGKHKTNELNDGYMGSGKHLKRAIRKHGIEEFKKEILFVFDNEEEMNAKEREIVTEEFCRRRDTYNICRGGQGGFDYINRSGSNGSLKGVTTAQVLRENDPIWVREWSEKHHQAVSASNRDPIKIEKRKRTMREKFGEKGTQSFTGKNHTEEIKAILSAKASARIELNGNPMQGKAWVNRNGDPLLIERTDLDTYLSKGYSIGKIDRSAISAKERKVKQLERFQQKQSLMEEMQPLYERYRNGESLREIACDLPYSYRSLHKRFQKLGWDTKKE